MTIGVVGGGITGLFTAYHLEQEGANVVLYEPGILGAQSTHAAGIIEPTTAYRINTVAFVRRALRLWRSGTARFRGVDGRWLMECLARFEKEPPGSMDRTLLEMGRDSMSQYEALSGASDDFGFVKGGLLETFENSAYYEEQRTAAFSRTSVAPVEVREIAGSVGGLFFPEVAWLDTEQMVSRLVQELKHTRVVRERVTNVSLDGSVATLRSMSTFEAIAVCTGVTSRTLGVPLTGVRGCGWHIRTKSVLATATIAVDRGIALVPLESSLKVTGGWAFDLGPTTAGAQEILEAVGRLVSVDRVLDFAEGSRPCTPDGLPTVGRKQRIAIANGGFRLGWSFAPAMGRLAADLCLGKSSNDPFLSRYCQLMHSATLA